jgi:hypothetical protein
MVRTFAVGIFKSSLFGAEIAGRADMCYNGFYWWGVAKR